MARPPPPPPAHLLSPPPPLHLFPQPHRLSPRQLSNLLGFVISIVGVSFVGHLGELQLSASVLATSIFNVTG